MKRFVSWSGGEDSTASIILCHEKGIHLDGVVMSEVMFDHRRNISGESPETQREPTSTPAFYSEECA